ncbi:DHH family phosphoesterase [Aureibacter tunicatorum]|uniref:Phosphoesterase RecJ-like protein n=1 Tax=Aureibacter tunicatorum TaxID=866807 RepID=A0AAE3XSR1_9BACT|nr:DHH family phosphoesterase [Aureibacter tunicatorum]MDR6241320.1 phosphoesterase RecJ-like protein [Aureibacter tunicatorum]BDD03579.1 exopolyphosphatase [Aureibacter tunicatorum]
MLNLEAFGQLISNPQKVVIIPHMKPDADALGSCLGWQGVLDKLGHKTSVVSPTDFPGFLKWMKGVEDVLIFDQDDSSRAKAEKLISEAEIVFCVDFSCLNRINELGEIVRGSSAVKVVVDHHLEPECFSEHMIWDAKAAATAEITFDTLVALGYKDLIDVDIANDLYAGIMTDTGCFKHSNTSKNVHEVVAQLIDLGAENSKVGSLIYDTNSLDKLRFLGYALSEKLVVHPEMNTAYFKIDKSDLQKFKSKTGDTEGLVNYALSLEGIVFAAMIIEREDGVKLSLRSKGSFAVNEFARDHFNGGGHKNASGGRSDYNFEKTVSYFEELLPKYKDKLSKVDI